MCHVGIRQAHKQLLRAKEPVSIIAQVLFQLLIKYKIRILGIRQGHRKGFLSDLSTTFLRGIQIFSCYSLEIIMIR